MILTIPVLLYQLLFVAILFVASRLGKTTLYLTLVGCLVWTTTHLFLPPLMFFQTAVIVISFFVFRRKMLARQALQPAEPQPRQG